MGGSPACSERTASVQFLQLRSLRLSRRIDLLPLCERPVQVGSPGVSVNRKTDGEGSLLFECLGCVGLEIIHVDRRQLGKETEETAGQKTALESPADYMAMMLAVCPGGSWTAGLCIC